jgi:protoporphyrinogen oxidase
MAHKKIKHISILGGGPAGLAAGYHAKKCGLPFTIYEAEARTGGNAVTFAHGDFLFDSGAHRLHDKDPEIISEIKGLFGADLKKVGLPSQIYHGGKFIDFPLSPLNLMKNLGLYTFSRAAVEVVISRLRADNKEGNFEKFALHAYGKTIARLFLLNYSEKLWGKPGSELSLKIAGKRLKGMDLRTFIMETLFWKRGKTEHMEGLFYYPTAGIGAIPKKLEEYCGEDNIATHSRVTKIIHDGSQIRAVEINDERIIETDAVISTLPLTLFLESMEPSPPGDILRLAKSLHYRNIILVAIFLNRKRISSAATVYFPGPDFPFTRIYEPINRSVAMSPPGKTSLVAEIPCQSGDSLWGLTDEELIRRVRSRLIEINLIKNDEVLDAAVRRMPYAYPVLEIGYEEIIGEINTFLERFDNLKLSGRNGKFVYSWIHDMMRFGKEIIEELLHSQTHED